MKITAPLFAVLVLCTRIASAYDSVIVINEIHYNAPAGETEWIELRNLNGVDVNTAGWTISSGIDFTFPATGTGSFIPGHGYLLIAATPALLPGSIGPFAGQLDNGGETIRLRNLNGRIMDEVNYDDEGEWPIGADGSGATLARRRASAASGAEAWAASTILGGTPGARNFQPGSPDLRTHFAAGASWKYRDTDAAPPAGWNDDSFVDTSWSSGAAPLGTQPTVTSLTVTTNLVERFRAGALTGLADGATVPTWTDTATGDGVAQNAVPGATTPTFRTASTPNGKPAVRFDGNDELRTTQFPGFTPTGGWAFFAVLKGNAAQSNGLVTDGSGAYIWDRHLTGPGNPLTSLKSHNGFFGLQKRYDDGSGLGGPVSSTAISSVAWQIVAVRRNRALNRFEMWVNGVMQASEGDSGAALSADPINIGRHGSIATGGFNGDIAELLIYKDGLSESDFQKVGMYLENEYGLTTAFQVVATPLSPTAPVSYLRQSFNFPGDPARTTLRLNHTMADGAVFYLNGLEILRANMPGGAVGHTTAAASVIAAPAATGMVPVPSGALLNGNNVLAVSLHKAAGSTVTFFDAALESVELPTDPATAGQLRFHEIAGASDAAFYVELENTSGAALNTSGWTIKSSTGQTAPLPSQMLDPGQLLLLDPGALGFTPADGTRLYLLAPGGTLLRDAREVTNRLRGLVNGGRWGHPTTATPGTANVAVVTGDIVINEIFYHASNDGPEQWVELYNKGAAAVDVSSWKFTDGIGFDFPATPGPTSIPAGGYLVVAWDPAAFTALHPAMTALGPWSGSLSRKGELITLRDANDNVADQLTYADGGRWSRWADGGGSSLELKDPQADNSRGEAWEGSDESGQSAWETVTYSGLATNPAPGDPPTWNEFCFGLLDSGEFLIDDLSVKNVTLGNVELLQNSTFGGGTAAFWRIIGNHAGTVQDDPLLAGSKVLKVAASGTTEHMHNHATTTLKNGASFHTINSSQTYAISFRAKWLRGSNRLHTRLYCNRLARQTLLNMPATGGTPGAVNRSAVPNLGPTFDALAHSPVIPAATEAATVKLRVADPDGIAAVELFTSLNGAAFVSTAMSPDGSGLHTATVPGQSAGAQVQFYIRATDTPGAISFYPAAGPASRAMIPWQDGKAILQMPAGGRPHNLRVIMPGADANEMYKLENVMSNGSRPCTVILDESEIYYGASVRLKSSEHGRFNVNRVGFNIQFAGDELFLGAHPAVSADRSGGLGQGQKEILIKAVSIAAGGIHASEDDIIRVIAPVATGTGAAYSGVTLTSPAILSKTRFDDAYLDGQWDNGGAGPVFKYERVYVLTQTINPTTRVVDPVIVPENPKIPQDSTGPPGVNVTNLGANKEFYRWYWLIENARGNDDYQKIMDVTNAIGQTAGSAAFKTLTTQFLDVSTLLRGHVPAILYGVVDNYLVGGAQHNVLFYFPPGGKAVLIPWDLDFLSQGSANASLTGGQDLPKFLTDGSYKRLYYCHLLDVLNRSFNDTFLTRWATHYSTFGTDDMVGSLTYLRARATFARDSIYGTNVGGLNPTLAAAVPIVPFTRTSASPITVATPFTTVTGTGWINIAEIRLDGSTEPLAVTWTSVNAWSLQLPVLADTNTFTLRPYSKDGSLATTPANANPFVTVTVTGSGGIFPAGPGNLIASEIHFNPPGSGDLTEFIELLNITAATLDLAGSHFDEELGQGISFTFASGTTIPPGGRILVVRDAAAFAAAYPGAGPVASGVFTGALDNSGESLVLYSAAGQVIFRFDYPDNIDATDGNGRSLVRVIGCTPNPADYTWRASMANGGNPGATDALMFSGDPLADLDFDRHSALFEYAFGTSDTVFNPATDFLQLNGVLPPTWTALPNADCAAITLESSNDLTTWSGAFSPSRRYWRLRATLR